MNAGKIKQTEFLGTEKAAIVICFKVHFRHWSGTAGKNQEVRKQVLWQREETCQLQISSLPGRYRNKQFNDSCYVSFHHDFERNR
jgi:hypothetical protein